MVPPSRVLMLRYHCCAIICVIKPAKISSINMPQNKIKDVVLPANELRFSESLLTKLSLNPDDNATFVTDIHCSIHCTDQVGFAANHRRLQLINFHKPRSKDTEFLWDSSNRQPNTLYYSQVSLTSKCKQNFSSRITSFSRFLTCSASLITRHQTPNCDGTSVPSSAKL